MNSAQVKTSVNDEIREMLASLNLPEDLRRVIGEGIAKLRAGGFGQGLPIGAKAPEFQLSNQDGREVKLSDTLSKGAVVLKFIRGEWCPICNIEVAALKRIQPRLKESGATVLIINPQKPEKGVAIQSKHELGFDILSDEDQEVSRRYNLQFTVPVPVQEAYKAIGLNLPEHTADGSWNLPVPATFVLDAQGFIRAHHVDVDYARRMEPFAILEALHSIR